MPVTRHGPRKVGLRFFQSTPTLLVLYTYGRAQLRCASSTNYNMLKYDFQSSKSSASHISWFISGPGSHAFVLWQVPGPRPSLPGQLEWGKQVIGEGFVLWYTLLCGWGILSTSMFHYVRGGKRYFSRDWKETIVFQPSIFRCRPLGFREGYHQNMSKIQNMRCK